MTALGALNNLAAADSTALMPSLFVGHGDPMNVISDNSFTQQWQAVGRALPQARAILVVSAHWETAHSQVLSAPAPRTIHDFSGFAQIMYSLHYPAMGAPDVAAEVSATVRSLVIEQTQQWGFDHGTWCVLMKMLPQANIPVLQLSLGRDLSPLQHFELAQQLAVLRRRGVIVMGSGNIVHSMPAMAADYRAGHGEVLHDWALEFDQTVADHISDGNFRALTAFDKLGPAAKLAHPTLEHYLPLLYTLGVAAKHERASFFAQGFEGGSFSMRSVLLNG